MNDWIDHILDAGNRELGPDKKRLMWCKRENAQYVTGSGVSGVIAPLNKVKVVGRVRWSEDAIEDAKREQERRIGTLIF